MFYLCFIKENNAEIVKVESDACLFVPTDTLPNGTHPGSITDTFDYKDGRLRSAVGTDTEHLFHKLRTAVIVQV